MRPVIVTSIRRAPADQLARLREFGVATVHEAQGRTGLMRPYMRPLDPQSRVAGSAVTVLCHPGDNLMIHAALAVVQPGDVLVVATISESTDGMFGELLGQSCRARGVAGLVIDAGVRDTADLIALPFPVWSRAIHAQGTEKKIAGSVNVDVLCAGALVHPGDVIVADADGVVVVPRDRTEAVIQASEARVAKEARTRQRLAAGELGLDLYGLRDVLAAQGVEWRDA